jgi:hypothetical protein
MPTERFVIRQALAPMHVLSNLSSLSILSRHCSLAASTCPVFREPWTFYQVLVLSLSSLGHTFRLGRFTPSSCTRRALTKRSAMPHLSHVQLEPSTTTITHRLYLIHPAQTLQSYQRGLRTYHWVPLTCEASNCPTCSHVAYGTHRMKCGVRMTFDLSLWLG